MKTTAEVLEILKAAKIGKGAKIKFVSNHVNINYGLGRLDQYYSELLKVRELIDSTNPVRGCKYQGKGGINIETFVK